MPNLLCEGPSCNSGHSALDREAAVAGSQRGASEASLAAASHEARSVVSRQLAVTAHTRCGVSRRYGIAYALYVCGACGFERIYGNSDTTYGQP